MGGVGRAAWCAMTGTGLGRGAALCIRAVVVAALPYS
jgi:hypothetical protein